MPRNTTINYHKLTVDSLRTKYPSFILGIAIVVFVTLIILELLPNSYIITAKKTTPLKGSVLSKTQKVSSYVVQVGDDLWKISEKVYGSGFNGFDIAKFNNINDPNVLSAGQILKIPAITPGKPTVGEVNGGSTSQVTFTGTTYVVLPGDDLGIVAQKAYGDPMMWTKIANANKLTNPDTIREGQTLRIPR